MDNETSCIDSSYCISFQMWPLLIYTDLPFGSLHGSTFDISNLLWVVMIEFFCTEALQNSEWNICLYIHTRMNPFTFGSYPLYTVWNGNINTALLSRGTDSFIHYILQLLFWCEHWCGTSFLTVCVTCLLQCTAGLMTHTPAGLCLWRDNCSVMTILLVDIQHQLMQVDLWNKSFILDTVAGQMLYSYPERRFKQSGDAWKSCCHSALLSLQIGRVWSEWHAFKWRHIALSCFICMQFWNKWQTKTLGKTYNLYSIFILEMIPFWY